MRGHIRRRLAKPNRQAPVSTRCRGLRSCQSGLTGGSTQRQSDSACAGDGQDGDAGVLVADVGRKEFQKSANGMLAGIGNRGGTASVLRKPAALTGAAASMTVGRLRRSALTPTPYR
jgi:hypothetical protein